MLSVCLIERDIVASSAEKDKRERLELPAPVEPQLAEAIRRIAGSDCPVLIVGERGVGKRTVSGLLHALSDRSRKEYKILTVAGAEENKILAALPGSGTLVLVEAADLPIHIQEELVRRYSGVQSAGNNRLICTTRHDLEEAVRDGRIREDFYYFISAVSLRIPPLRHRREQLLTIADSLLERYARQYDRPKPQLSPEMRAFLLKHTWPGNLAELDVSMKTCVAIGDPDFSLAALRAASPEKRTLPGERSNTSLKAATRAASIRIERQLISEVLKATDWNRKQTAKELNISYKTLLYKLKQNGITSLTASQKNGVHP